MQRIIKIGDWLFEIKQVKAIKASEYGKPYSAIATINFLNSSAYVDGLLTNQQLSRQDFQAIKTFSEMFDAECIEYQRFQFQQ